MSMEGNQVIQGRVYDHPEDYKNDPLTIELERQTDEINNISVAIPISDHWLSAKS